MFKLTLKTKKIIFLSFIALHFSIITIVCISNTINSFHQTYYEDVKSPPLIEIKNYSFLYLSTIGIQQYASAAGIDAGYGFFAPNVASTYVLKFELKDADGKIVDTIFIPPFQTREGLVRFSTLLGSFQDRLIALEKEVKEKKTRNEKRDLYSKYLDVVIKSIGRYLLDRDQNGASHASGSLYLYNYPTLREAITDLEGPSLTFLMDLAIKPLRNAI